MKTTIEYTSVLKDFKDIEERNYAFNNLDAQSQRLEIAWDALQLIVNKVIGETSSGYWDDKLFNIARESENPKILQDKLLNNKKIKGCEVCQRGLIMLSTIRIGNTIAPNDSYISEGSWRNVQGFSMDSMNKQEDYYEGFTKALFSYKHPYGYKTLERKANILCNILVNGDFKEKDFTDYLIN